MVSRRSQATGLLGDFRNFIMRGNVVDLAVGVIIGGAFGKIVSSFVEDLVMPGLINPIVSQAGKDWREAVIGPGIKIGSFLGALIDFLIISFVIFLMIKLLEQFKRKEEAAETPAPEPTVLLQERMADTLDRIAQVLESRER